jgi:hypothetical protein
VRCSSLVDWPVYPRLRGILRASQPARNQGVAVGRLPLGNRRALPALAPGPDGLAGGTDNSHCLRRLTRIEAVRSFRRFCALPLRSVALMLVGTGNCNEPALSPWHPQLIHGSEVCRRIIERAGSHLNLVRAVHDRKHRRPAHGTEVAIGCREPPASSLTRDRNAVCLPDGEEVADRSSLLALVDDVSPSSGRRAVSSSR